MPGPSGSTPILGLPYPLETDSPPDVAGAFQFLATAVENAIVRSQAVVGAVIEWYSDTLPTEGTWLFMHGQSVSEGAYPALAAVYASWVSGGNIILPDTRDKFSIGAGSGGVGGPAVGATGGSATATLTTGMIPHFSVGVSITDPGHFHAAQPGFDVIVQTTSSMNLENFGSGTEVSSNVGNPNTDTKSTGISGTVTFGSSSPTPVPTVPPYIAAHKIVRAA
jgi:hypothetical protein